MNNEKENINIEYKRNIKSKSILLLIMIVILVISFIIYGINVINKSISNESALLSYLKKKYHNNFKIIELVASKQYVEPAVDCDGSAIIPEKEIKGKYKYYYEVLSISDNIKFNVYLINDNGRKTFKDSYDMCKDFENISGDIQNYAITNIENTIIKTESFYENTDYTLFYDYYIKVYLDGKFEDIIDNEFTERLYLIRDYNDNIEDEFHAKYDMFFDKDINIYVVIYDSNNNYIKFPEFDKKIEVHNNNEKFGTDIESWRKSNGNK